MGSPPRLDELPVASAAQLAAHFHRYFTPRSAFRVGIEQEKLPLRPDGGLVPYEAGPAGGPSVAALLGALEARGFSAQREDGHAIALRRGDERITLEPGAQVELSGAALPTAHACAQALDAHVREVTTLAAGLGFGFVAGGFHPFARLDEIAWTPKRRYAVMREFLPRQGSRGLDMMKRTATVQSNHDFEDEADAVAKMRAGFGVSSIVTAMFAASPIAEGRPTGHKSLRAAIWLDTDERRCGFVPGVFEDGFGFAGYVEWALDVPMFFVVRDGHYHAVGDGFTFRRFMAEGWQGHRATLEDWETHLSTLFPEVRLKRTIELRGADAGPLAYARALGALWRGLLDAPDARDAAWALVAGVPLAERQRLRAEVPRSGLADRLSGRSLRDLAGELCAIAAAGLRTLPGGEEDAALLQPVAEAVGQGRCPADDMLDDHAAAGGDPAVLTARWDLAAQLG